MGEQGDSWPPAKRPSVFFAVGRDGSVRVSWKMLVAVVTLITGASGAMHGLLTQADLASHVAAQHVVSVADEPAIGTVRDLALVDHEALLGAELRLDDAEKLRTDVAALRRSVNELRADYIAHLAAESVPPAGRAKTEANLRDQVLDNLQNGRPPRAGIEVYFR